MTDFIKALALAAAVLAVSIAVSIIVGLLAPIAFFVIITLGAWFVIKLLKDDGAAKP